MNYQQLTALPKNYLYNQQYPVGHAIIQSDSPIVISAPHTVSQNRLGRYKARETGSAKFALALQQLLQSNLIIKTQNKFDDANFDVDCPYRHDLTKLITTKPIKYLFDIHGLASTRPCDINFGINFGDNITTNPQFFDRLVQTLINKGFTISIDQPFCGRYPAIAADIHQKTGIWTIQIEINCAITNNSANIKRCNLLLNTFAALLQCLK